MSYRCHAHKFAAHQFRNGATLVGINVTVAVRTVPHVADVGLRSSKEYPRRRADMRELHARIGTAERDPMDAIICSTDRYLLDGYFTEILVLILNILQ